mgnify:CR=1 FL=1
MGKLNFGITGQVRGSVNNLTFAVSKGINYVKQKATSVANPRTLAQRIQRNRFTAILRIFQQIPSVVNKGFVGAYAHMSEYSAFMKVNIIPATVLGSGDDVNVKYSDLKLSQGSLQPTPISGILATGGDNDVEISFSTYTLGSQESSDLAYAIAFNETTQKWSAPNGDVLRSAGEITVSFEDNCTTNDIIRAYLFFVGASNGKISNSQNSDLIV